MIAQVLKKVLNIKPGTDVNGTIERISSGVSFKGYNSWILFCSVILASIGLDVNSVAVIIGAMLISPLMSPILGVGLSVGIHDKELFLRSLRNLGIATLISLTGSTLYFLSTPFGDITSELLGRTHPTLLDVMVAFFGGVAGIVSMSRSESTNAIPGVAIATALMPPLCTAGYGLASGRWEFFLGAFYLFFINAIFIALATYLLVKYLKFPIKQYVDKQLQRRYTRLSWFFVSLSLIPSFYFLYTVYKDNSTKKTIETLVIKQLEKDGNEILKWNLDNTDSVKYIEVYYSGNPLQRQTLQAMEETCRANGLNKCRIKALRVNLTKEEVTGLSTDVARQMLNEWEYKMMEKWREDSLINNQWRYDMIDAGNEILAAFPFIDSAKVGRSVIVVDSFVSDTVITVNFKSKRALNAQQQKSVSDFMKLRLHTDTAYLNRM